MIGNNYEEWFEPLKNLIQEESDEPIWLCTNEPISGIIGFTNTLRLEPGGHRIRCVFDCDGLLDINNNDGQKVLMKEKIIINDLAINVIKDGKVGTFRHLNLQKNFDTVETTDYFLNMGVNRDLSSLEWFDMKNLKTFQPTIQVQNETLKQIRCHVYACGLNFRDVLLASGKLIAGPESLLTDCIIGFEFAGRDSRTGRRICGFNLGRCMATLVDVREDMVTHIPDHWSMEDAVTVLSTYITVWYGLIDRAQLKQSK